MLRQGVHPLYMVITFRWPLSPEEFTQLIAESEMHVTKYRIRVIDGRGARATIGGQPSANERIPAGMLSTAIEGIEQASGGRAELKGFFETQGIVYQEGYRRLLAHPKVFLVDVSVTLAHQILQSRGWKVRLDEIQFAGGSPYWDMEDLGLDLF